MFRRVALELHGPDDDAEVASLPTDERLRRVQEGQLDPGLVAQYFQFGRYLLICSSRPGTMPANLQGVWNHKLKPDWDSDFHLNINVQMNYWPVEICNLAECHLPLFDLLESLREPGRKTAKVHYNCNGFVVHHITDIWGLCARGNMEVDIAWKDSRITSVTLRAQTAGRHQIHLPGDQTFVELTSAGKAVPFDQVKPNLVAVELEAGKTYQLSVR